jgi:hypothetical protein
MDIGQRVDFTEIRHVDGLSSHGREIGQGSVEWNVRGVYRTLGSQKHCLLGTQMQQKKEWFAEQSNEQFMLLKYAMSYVMVMVTECDVIVKLVYD